jgi:GxxExxY protein
MRRPASPSIEGWTMIRGRRGLNDPLNHEAHKEHEAISAKAESVGQVVIDAGLKVHRALGPGLLESAYEHCLAHELVARGAAVRRQVSLPIMFDGERIDAGYRLDLLVDDLVVVEVKAVDALSPLHSAQILTYLKLSAFRLGFLMNFNVKLFKQGLRRFVL